MRALNAASPSLETSRHDMVDRSAAVPPELVQLLNGGRRDDHAEAWAALVEKHSRLLVNVARSMIADHDGAMDAYAYVLERLYEDDCRRLRGYAADGRSAFSTWLVVVARRLCVDHCRRRYGRAPRGEGDPSPARAERASRRRLLDLTAAAIDLDSIVDDRQPSPDEAMRAAQRDEALVRVMAGLAPADRLLLMLRFEDDLSMREIGVALELPTVFHVYRRLAAVLASLRRALAARGVDGSAP